MCEEPSDAAMLQDRELLDPKVANKPFPARVDALYEVYREGRHRGPKREDEWQWLLELE
jgi:hypothetical protein